MSSVCDKITNYLEEQEDISTDGAAYLEDAALLEKMYNFIISLDPDKLNDMEAGELVDIIDELADEDEDEDEIDEIKRVRISPADKRKRSKAYKKNKSKIKIAAKRYRRTAGYKRYKRKSKRMSRTGKTSTGKRVRKFI
jgi:hypothetical protein